MPIACLESFASQKRTLALYIPALQEVAIPRCVIRVPCFLKEAYSEVMSVLLCDHHRRPEMGAEDRQWACQFNWDEIAHQQEAFYYEALS